MKLLSHASLSRLLISTIMVLGLMACSIGHNPEAAKGTANSLYAAVAAGDTEKLLNYYDEAFYQQVSREDYLALLDKIYKKVGAYQSHNLEGWQASELDGHGEVYTLTYTVKYSNYSTTEALTMTSDDPPRLIGHSYNSTAFIPD